MRRARARTRAREPKNFCSKKKMKARYENPAFLYVTLIMKD